MDQLTKVESLRAIPAERMVTFSVIAHVDHGKSSLSQRLLERQGNVAVQQNPSQSALDTLKVEQARGITVKAVTASMLYEDEERKRWLLNLVDCPGHSDFAHEVRRSLSCCDGALLLVDASQGIEAQTLSVAAAADASGVPLVAACSKCDLPTARPEDVALQLAEIGLVRDPDAVLQLSAKTGHGVDAVLPAVARSFSPRDDVDDTSDDRRRRPLRARVVDSKYDDKRGVICVVQVVEGHLREQQKLAFFSSALDDSKAAGQTYGVQEVGLLTPKHLRVEGGLVAGCVGYVVCGLRNVREAAVGDTIFDADAPSAEGPLDRTFRPARPGLYASVFPPDGALFEDMARAVDRLALNDASVTVQREPPRPTLGLGLRLGFLGLLHLSVFSQRLRDEFQYDMLFCAPNVPYRFVSKADADKALENMSDDDDANDDDQKSAARRRRKAVSLEGIRCKTIETLDDWPSEGVKEWAVFEPVVDLDVVVPSDCLGGALQVLETRVALRSVDSSVDAKNVIKATAPWATVVEGLGEALAEATRGYASLNVENDQRWRRNDDLVKVDVAINNQSVNALSFVCSKDDAQHKGRTVAAKLKDLVPRQLVEIIIQARVGAKSVARERIAPFRKDVLSKSGKVVGGGDVSRKKKLLEKQKAGKKRQKTVANVELDQNCLWAALAMPTEHR